MASTTDNTTDRAREDPDEADWARWEETFRDAKPVLPEAALARIEASIQREAGSAAAAAAKPPHMKRWILLLLGILIVVNVTVVWMINRDRFAKKPASPATPTATPGVLDHYPMDVMIGPPLVAPDRPILPLAENADLFDDAAPEKPKEAPAAGPSAALMKGAERYCAGSLDSWRQLGLLEMHRVAGTPAGKVSLFPPHDEDYHIVAAWRLLPLDANNARPFYDQTQRLATGGISAEGEFWYAMYSLYLTQYEKGAPDPSLAAMLQTQPASLPSKLGDRARFDLLVELGEPGAQAAMDVLTTRSYRPLTTLRDYHAWDKKPVKLPLDLPVISHDLIERLFALRLLGRKDDALKLLQEASKIPYLNAPADLAVLLARLGPDAAWDQVLHPLMEDEVAFIENPPTFNQTDPRPRPDVTVQAGGKSIANGITTYPGPTVSVSVGPWKIACEKLTAYHNDQGGMLLSGSGAVHIEGVLGLLGASADEFTFNTATGELKLAGRVHLNAWEGERDAKACTITRTGQVRE